METKMCVKRYDTLPDEAVMIRREVFVEEQGFVHEFDEEDNAAWHFLLFDGDLPVATCRCMPGKDPSEYVIGRIAVRKPYRGRHLGAQIVAAAEEAAKAAGGKRTLVHAQVRAKPFYERQGFTAFGEEDLDEGCPHVWMCKK